MPFRRNQNRDRLANDLFRRVAEDALRAPVPICDDATKVFSDNRVITGLYYRSNALTRVQRGPRLIGGFRESTKIGHHAQILGIEATARVVGDDPNCAYSLFLHVKRN